MSGRAPDIDGRLRDIMFWGQRAAGYAQGMTLEAFLLDEKSQDAVIRCLEVAGEACGQKLRLEPGFEQRYPALELSKAYRARNRTAHGYGSVDLATVWMTATEACPRLVDAAQKLLQDRKDGRATE